MCSSVIKTARLEREREREREHVYVCVCVHMCVCVCVYVCVCVCAFTTYSVYTQSCQSHSSSLAISFFKLYRRLCCKGPNPTRPNFSILCIGLESCGKSSILAVLSGDDLHKIEPTIGELVVCFRLCRL